jgi:phosphopantetheine adenylyltransferase
VTRAVYPGSFNPPTVGHLAIIEAAIDTHRLVRLDLVVSRRALAKGVIEHPTLDQRVEVIRGSVAHLPEVSVVVTDLQLIADIAAGYDIVVMGADKWRQVNDLVFYDSIEHRDRALAALPRLAVAGRGHDPVPEHARLDVPGDIDAVSSSAARSGTTEWMTAEAIASGLWTP